MKLDSEGLEVLSKDECIELMRSVPIGRIVFTHQALPAIRPVNFSVVNSSVVIPTVAGSRLAAAARNSIVAFQTDQFDPVARTGWSVTAIGPAEVVRSQDANPQDGRQSGTQTNIAQTIRDTIIRISLERVSGRRLCHR